MAKSQNKIFEMVEALIKDNGVNDETFEKVRELNLNDMDKIRAIRYYKQCRIELENLDPEDAELAKLTKKLREERMQKLASATRKTVDKVVSAAPSTLKGGSFGASKLFNSIWQPLKEGWKEGAK